MTTLAPGMPPVQYAKVNGIRMAYYEVGERGVGVPIVLSHGFPELAFSWRHQLKALAEAGRWAIAPDQRGYGLTEAPEAVNAYDMAHLTGDLIGLLDHVGAPRAIWCGHDWGGIIVWQMSLMHPDRTAGVIGLNTPFYPRPPADPIAIMRARLGEEMYIVHFQKPGEADAILGADARKTMSFFMRRPPEGGKGAGEPTPIEAFSAVGSAQGFAHKRQPGEGSTFPLVRMVQGYDPAQDTRATFLTDAEFEVFATTFARTGFTGGINWYRNFTRNWAQSADLPMQVNTPSLMIMAEKDAVLPPLFRRRNGAVRDGPGKDPGDRLRPLDPARGARAGEPHPDRLAGTGAFPKPDALDYGPATALRDEGHEYPNQPRAAQPLPRKRALRPGLGAVRRRA